MGKRKEDENEIKSKIINCKVSNYEFEEIRNILAISGCKNMSELIRKSIKQYGASIKEDSI